MHKGINDERRKPTILIEVKPKIISMYSMCIGSKAISKRVTEQAALVLYLHVILIIFRDLIRQLFWDYLLQSESRETGDRNDGGDRNTDR